MHILILIRKCTMVHLHFFAGHCSNRNNDSYTEEEMLTKEKCSGETWCNYEHSHTLSICGLLTDFEGGGGGGE